MTKQREIKFRAWLHDDEEMVEFEWFYGAFGVASPDLLDNNKITVMQYTGFHDKNGKEVYEGDIVTLSKCSDKEDWWEVAWDQEVSCFRAYPLFYNKGGCFFRHNIKMYEFSIDLSGFGRAKIIGNIYENPELLEPKEK